MQKPPSTDPHVDADSLHWFRFMVNWRHLQELHLIHVRKPAVFFKYFLSNPEKEPPAYLRNPGPLKIT